MIKTIYRLKPDGFLKIGELESWLSHMAEKGWHAKSVGVHLVKFTKCEPKKIKYRVEFSSKSEFMDDAQLAMYKEYGWTHIDNYITDGFRRAYVFSSPEELNVPELHTDPIEQSFTLKDLNKNLRNSIFLNTILTFMSYLMYYSVFLSVDTPYLNLVKYGSLAQFMPLIMMTYFLIGIIKNFLAIRRLKNNLNKGITINHNANWRPAIISARCSAIFTIVVITSLLVYGFALSNKQASTDLPLDTTSIPIVFLSDVEAGKKVTRHDPNYNVLHTHNSIFATVNYFSMEKGSVSNINDKNEVYNSQLTNTVYKVRFKWLVQKVVEDMLTFPPRSYEKLPSNDFDLLYVNEAGDTFDIIASRGHGIVQLDYTGKASLEELLNALSSTLDTIK